MKYIIGIIAGTIAGAVIGYIFARKNDEVVCCCGCDASKCPDFVEPPHVNKFADDNSNDNEDPNKFDSDDDGGASVKKDDYVDNYN